MAKTTGPITPEVISPADRVRASRIRKALREDPENVPEDDVKWMEDYHGRQKSRGASKTHEVSYTERTAESVGEGDAASVAAAAVFAPQIAKEEGRRYDSLILAATSALNASAKVINDSHAMIVEMAGQVLKRNGELEKVGMGMLETIRSTHIQLTNAQAEMIRSQAEADAEGIVAEAEQSGGGGVDGMIAQFMPVILQELAKRGLAAGTPQATPPSPKTKR